MKGLLLRHVREIQWKVRCVQTGEERYFRVPFTHDGNHSCISYVFDLATGIYWNIRSKSALC